MSLAAQYEDLVGAEGPRIQYRPERFQAPALYGHFPPEVHIGGASLKLLDISMSGIAAAVRRGADLGVGPGAEVAVRLVTGEAELFRARARVCRVEPTPFHTKIALHLISDYVDLSKTVDAHNKQLAEQVFSNGLSDGVDPAYRRHCADVLHLLRRYRAALGELDNGAAQDASRSERLIEELLPLCEERLLPEWREAWRAGNALVADVMPDPEALQAAKRYTELVLTPEFLPGPLWRRGYEKPLGYPGDYEMMNSIYARRWEGETAFAKLLHRVSLDVGECISARMAHMEQAIVEAVAAKPGNDPVRIASVGCGPAQEVENYLRIKSRPRCVEFTLIDQDEKALSCAYSRTYPEVVRLRGEAEVRCLHVSFSQIMRTGAYFDKLPPQDLIYTAGLTDYLSAKRARALVTDLYGRLTPGGRLIVANMGKAPQGTLWPLEFICDWSLSYRDEEEMRGLAADFSPAVVELSGTDPTGPVRLLRLFKPY